MAEGEDYILDLSHTTGKRTASAGARQRRPLISVRWRCCSVYSRIYRNADATAYVGYCPRCARPVRIKVAPGGTDARFFEAW